jgi:transcriptional adapter 2-alpha
LNFPLFEPDWGADEELLLLEGIEMYGIGNWSDISDHVGTKTGPQSKEHYFKIYIDIPTTPIPVII